jgi:hypothetical protein
VFRCWLTGIAPSSVRIGIRRGCYKERKTTLSLIKEEEPELNVMI